MLRFVNRIALLSIASILLPTLKCLAAAGTETVAIKGQPAHVSDGWPKGVGELVNDETRTIGLGSWFTEWPNDVLHYGFEITSTEDVNRLIEKLVAIKTDLRQVRLSYLKEPKGLGWVTQLPAGNNIAVIFSIGNQSQIDEWYKHVRKPFGVMEFLAAPIAVPPTITVFVQNGLIDLDKLSIPKGINVESGYVPGVFYRFNTKQEKEKEDAAAKGEAGRKPKVELDPDSQVTADRIDAFLKNHREGKTANR